MCLFPRKKKKINEMKQKKENEKGEDLYSNYVTGNREIYMKIANTY